MDRILDLIVGEETPSNKYALVCEKCYNHNGLAAAEEFEQIRNRSNIDAPTYATQSTLVQDAAISTVSGGNASPKDTQASRSRRRRHLTTK